MRAHLVLARMVGVACNGIRLRKSFARICPATRGYMSRVRRYSLASLASWVMERGDSLFCHWLWVGILDAGPLLGVGRVLLGLAGEAGQIILISDDFAFFERPLC